MEAAIEISVVEAVMLIYQCVHFIQNHQIFTIILWSYKIISTEEQDTVVSS